MYGIHCLQGLSLLFNNGVFRFFTPFAFELLAMWMLSLPWSDLIMTPVCSNPCKEGRGVLKIWQQRFGCLLSTEFHLLAKKCLFEFLSGELSDTKYFFHWFVN